MHDTTTRVDALATQLALTDRRALSQAWYSALHLAERDAPRAAHAAQAAARGRVPDERSLTAAPRPGNERANGDGNRGAAKRAARANPANARECGGADGRTGSAARRPGTLADDRRRAPAALGRALEGAVLRRAACGRLGGRGRASFTVAAGAERVHVVVRAERGRMHVVALCAPAMRERVERALAHARFALAARGLRAEAA